MLILTYRGDLSKLVGVTYNALDNLYSLLGEQLVLN
jgi:hypothetical protein